MDLSTDGRIFFSYFLFGFLMFGGCAVDMMARWSQKLASKIHSSVVGGLVLFFAVDESMER